MSRTLPALLLLPVVVCATGCPPRPAPAPPPGEGVSPRSLEARLHGAAGERIAARPGDALLRNAHLSAVVAAVPLPLGFSRTLGALVDLVPAGAETDSLQGLSPRVRVAGKTLAVEALEVRQDEDGVVVTGRLPGHPYLDVRTTFRLPRDGSCLEVATAVTNRGHEPRVVGVEDDLYVGNVRWFVPGLGLVEGAASVEAPWLAQAGRGLAFAYGPATPGPLALELRALDIGDHRFFGAVRPFLGLAEVAPSRSVTWRRLVTAARGDVADAADLLHRALSAKGRRITGRVRAAGGGAPGPGTLVVARDEQGRPISRARVDADGLLSLHLPPGRVELVAIAPGLPASEPVTVEEGAEDDPVLTLPPAGRLRFSVRGGKGRPLPARLVLSGVHPTPDPDLGPVTHARGARNMVYSHDGEGSLPLAAGRYRVWATRGPEYDLASADVTVEPDREARVELSLARVVDTAGAVAADLHLHAAGSGDSDVSFEARVASLVAEGIELAVATDHNRVSDYGPAVEALGLSDRIHVVSGSEVSTTGTVRWGHFNAFPLHRDTSRPCNGSPPYSSVTPATLFRAVREHPGDQVIQVNHPRMPPQIGYFDLAGLDPATGRAASAQWSPDFDAIEVFNGIWLNRPGRVESNLADWFALLEAGHRFAATGNSDSHKLVLQEVGYPRTYLLVLDDDPATLTTEVAVDAIRSGRTLVSSGPFLRVTLAGRGPGETVRVSGKATLPLEVWVHAPTWVPVDRVEVVVGGTTLWTVPIPPARSVRRFHGRFDMAVERSTWVVVKVHGAPFSGAVVPGKGAVAWAFSSPVYVDHTPAGRVDSRTGVP